MGHCPRGTEQPGRVMCCGSRSSGWLCSHTGGEIISFSLELCGQRLLQTETGLLALT